MVPVERLGMDPRGKRAFAIDWGRHHYDRRLVWRQQWKSGADPADGEPESFNAQPLV
jgi:hypothetical protein